MLLQIEHCDLVTAILKVTHSYDGVIVVEGKLTKRTDNARSKVSFLSAEVIMAYRITHIRQYTRSRALNLTATNHSAAKSLLAGRVANMKLLRENASDLDLLIIGGGATGSGAALDAALRGLKVACIEREDFSSGTSSRSTKLLWGGSRYLVQAFISLLSSRLVARPIQTVKNFITDFRMVLNCHRERRFLLEKQPHLTKWMPIAVPLARWVLWPPPFGFIPAALGPLGIFPLFFKFVSTDGICGGYQGSDDRCVHVL